MTNRQALVIAYAVLSTICAGVFLTTGLWVFFGLHMGCLAMEIYNAIRMVAE
jgi:hypothetical protein